MLHLENRLAVLAVLLLAQIPARLDESTTAGLLVERAGKYVEAYEKDFSAVVCEELQLQSLVRPDGRIRQRRELKSDLALVKIDDASWMQQVFRDVLAVDKKPVKNRDDRLRKLFLEGSKKGVEQARAIAKESGRYNLGPSRTGVSPILPLRILNPRLAPGFRFTMSGPRLMFEEFKSPSYLRYRNGSTVIDLMSRGSFEIDAETGKVLAAELTAENPKAGYAFKARIRYRDEPELKMLVPVEMAEEYWQPAKPKEDRLEVAVTYSAFRRFQVKTTEIIK